MARTLVEVKRLCRVEFGHWILDGGIAGNRIHAPDYNKGGKPTTQQGRRAVWNIKYKRPIPEGYRIFAACDEPRCVNPYHMVCMTCAERGAQVAESGKWKGNMKRIAANRKSSRKRSVLSPELIQLIHASNKSGVQLSRELGITRQIISRVRVGKARSFLTVGSPFGLFTGLMASNDGERRRA